MGVKYDPLTGVPSNEDTDYNTLLEMWRDEKKKRQEVEGENTIIKGIGQNSPEMKALQKRVEELENSLSIALDINDKYQREEKKLKEDLARAKEDHQYDNLVHKKELKDLKKWLWDPKLDGSGR
jgi:predicted RNase H-like nuclease (RuvC/YqgF family)|tara:strand:+ start:196 stop:567 length:372 start_codon:yes stop_codon:yes gene_type:complete